MFLSLPTWPQSPTGNSAPVGTGTDPQAALPAKQLALPGTQLYQFGGHYDGEIASNLDGGLRRGSLYDGVFHVGFSADGRLFGLGTGGRFYVSAVQIQSGLPSQKLIGDLQGASNLAAESATRLYQLWYRQRYKWHDLSLRAGLIDLNQYFVTTDYANILMNASFGITPTISANIPVSIYPKPGLGAMAGAHWHDWETRLGVFQGDPNSRSGVVHQGQLLIGELGRRQIKVGLWHYSPARDPGSAQPDGDWGSYAIAQTQLLRRDGRLLNGFLQLGASPRQTNSVPYYFGAGIVLKGLFHERPGDRLSAGVAKARMRGTDRSSEIAYELTYLFSLDRRIYLQPDIQYIANPHGSGDLPNALVGILRLHIEFF